MSDDNTHEPIDRIYVEAETMLSDDEARLARRARVLAAVARAPAIQSAAPRARSGRRAWAPGGWLAAACVGVLGVFVATSLYQPPPHPAKSASAAPAPAAQMPPAVVSPPKIAAPAISKAVEAAPSPTASPAPRPENRLGTALSAEPQRRAFPAESAMAPAPLIAPSPPVATEERQAAEAKTREFNSGVAKAEAQDAARAEANEPRDRFFAAGRAATLKPSPLAQKDDHGARLQAAAAAGRSDEVDALLDEGASVDAKDAAGDTALMEAILADRPAVAAVLRRRGASLEVRNHAGQSARDMAAAKDDPALNRALGLEP